MMITTHEKIPAAPMLATVRPIIRALEPRAAHPCTSPLEDSVLVICVGFGAMPVDGFRKDSDGAKRQNKFQFSKEFPLLN